MSSAAPPTPGFLLYFMCFNIGVRSMVRAIHILEF